MTFVTKLTLQSGDRARLDDVVEDIKAMARRKGAEFTGPHSLPPEDYRVPQYKTAATAESFSAWSYTVYRREIDIVGHDDFARTVAGQQFPDGVHISVEVEQQRPMGD